MTAAACLATWGVLALLRRFEIVDRPNRRSSHSAPTPRGGGLAEVGCLLIAGTVAAQVWPAPAAMRRPGPTWKLWLAGRAPRLAL